jgi:hypothetical protein
MSGAETLVENLLIYYVDVTERQMTLVRYYHVQSHASTLVSLRQAQRITNPHILAQIELTILRARAVFGSDRTLCEVRMSARFAMSMMRSAVSAHFENMSRTVPGVPDELPPQLAREMENCVTWFLRDCRSWENQPEDDTLSIPPVEREADDIFDEEREADEDIRFLDGSPLLDTVRFF